VGLIVDTSEFIWIERQHGNPKDIVRHYGSQHIYGVSAMTIAELQHGVRRAVGESRRIFREQFLQNVLESFPIYPLDSAIALRLGDLDAQMQLMGVKQDIADLIIAATALEYRFEVATRNLKHFQPIPGLKIAVPVSQPLIYASSELPSERSSFSLKPYCVIPSSVSMNA
jgi:predicted nucleic acid-binding protein